MSLLKWQTQALIGQRLLVKGLLQQDGHYHLPFSPLHWFYAKVKHKYSQLCLKANDRNKEITDVKATSCFYINSLQPAYKKGLSCLMLCRLCSTRASQLHRRPLAWHWINASMVGPAPRPSVVGHSPATQMGLGCFAVPGWKPCVQTDLAKLQGKNNQTQKGLSRPQLNMPHSFPF